MSMKIVVRQADTLKISTLSTNEQVEDEICENRSSIFITRMSADTRTLRNCDYCKPSNALKEKETAKAFLSKVPDDNRM